MKDYNPHFPGNEDYGRFTRAEIREMETKKKCPVCGEKMRGSGIRAYDSDLGE